jgi:hypothetical protein
MPHTVVIMPEHDHASLSSGLPHDDMFGFRRGLMSISNELNERHRMSACRACSLN